MNLYEYLAHSFSFKCTELTYFKETELFHCFEFYEIIYFNLDELKFKWDVYFPACFERESLC